MTLEVKDLSIKNFERVVQLTDDTTKLNCIISIVMNQEYFLMNLDV